MKKFKAMLVAGILTVGVLASQSTIFANTNAQNTQVQSSKTTTAPTQAELQAQVDARLAYMKSMMDVQVKEGNMTQAQEDANYKQMQADAKVYLASPNGVKNSNDSNSNSYNDWCGGYGYGNYNSMMNGYDNSSNGNSNSSDNNDWCGGNRMMGGYGGMMGN